MKEPLSPVLSTWWDVQGSALSPFLFINFTSGLQLRSSFLCLFFVGVDSFVGDLELKLYQTDLKTLSIRVQHREVLLDAAENRQLSTAGNL